MRTDLEDTWAQIIERLADRWGRGIRYGQDPAQPDAIVRTGDQVFSRRQAMIYLTELASAVASFEFARGALIVLGDVGDRMKLLLTYFNQLPAATDRTIADLPEHEREAAQMMTAGLTLMAPHDVRGAVPLDPRVTTMAMVFHAMGKIFQLNHEETSQMLRNLRESERGLRGRLQLIASATDEGE